MHRGGSELQVRETDFVQVNLHLRDRITFPFRRVHKQRGVFSDVKRPGFVCVDVGVVNNDHAAGRQRLKRFRVERFDDRLIPIVKHI